MTRKKPVLFLSLGVLFSFLFVLLLVLVRTVDVAAIGPLGTRVGFSHLNGAFARWAGFRSAFYKISKYLGLLGLAVAAAIALFSLWQWVRRKSLWKVDSLLFSLDALYAATLVFYLLFSVVAVNYRPVLMPGETFPEASFPSSHTLLSCSAFGGAFWVIAKYFRKIVRVLAFIACGALFAATLLCRTLSGVHWLTDIFGGLLLGVALLFFFLFLLSWRTAKETSPAE